MTEKNKDRMTNTVLSLVASIIVVFVGFSLSSGKESSKEIELKIESKADKKDVEALKLELKEVKDLTNERLGAIQNSNSVIQTDVAWIKKSIDELKKK